MARVFWYILLACILSAILIGTPFYLYSAGKSDEFVGAFGTWVAALVVALVGLIAIPQLALNKASVDVDVFLKVSALIDDERRFGPNYILVRQNARLLQKATLSADGKSLSGIAPGYDSALPNAVQDVLSTLEQAGIIFKYASNKTMIEEYLGDVVINSYVALRNIIADRQRTDPHMYERFVEMYTFTANRWGEEAAAAVAYTNVES